jgi:hypothetical protein
MSSGPHGLANGRPVSFSEDIKKARRPLFRVRATRFTDGSECHCGPNAHRGFHGPAQLPARTTADTLRAMVRPLRGSARRTGCSASPPRQRLVAGALHVAVEVLVSLIVDHAAGQAPEDVQGRHGARDPISGRKISVISNGDPLRRKAERRAHRRDRSTRPVARAAWCQRESRASRRAASKGRTPHSGVVEQHVGQRPPTQPMQEMPSGRNGRRRHQRAGKHHRHAIGDQQDFADPQVTMMCHPQGGPLVGHHPPLALTHHLQGEAPAAGTDPGGQRTVVGQPPAHGAGGLPGGNAERGHGPESGRGSWNAELEAGGPYCRF